VASALNTELREQIVALAHARRRFGHRRIHDLLQPIYPQINVKRVCRLYRQADLAVRRRRKAKRPAQRQPLVLAQTPNEVWSMDFVSDSLANDRRLKLLTVADDYSHECVDIAVDHSISGQYVTRVLEQVARFRGYPQAVRTDNGPEFTSRAFLAWTQARTTVAAWRTDYNEVRPHSSLGRIPPARFAAQQRRHAGAAARQSPNHLTSID